MDKYMTIQEAANALLISYKTAREWLRDGEIPGDKIANRTFAIRSEVERMAEQFKGTYTIGETAKMIGRAPRTVYWLLTVEKKLTGFVWMRRWRIHGESITAHLKAREAKNVK